MTCTLLQGSAFHSSLLGVCHELGAVLASQECPGVSDCPAIVSYYTDSSGQSPSSCLAAAQMIIVCGRGKSHCYLISLQCNSNCTSH